MTEGSDALDLEPGVFTLDSPRAIAASLKDSAERSTRRKSEPYRSAMSMLTFYLNRAGRHLPAEQRERLERAKHELRALYGRAERPSGPRSGRRAARASRAMHVALTSALASGDPPRGNLAVPIFAHGSLVAEFYAPRGKDRQRPHARDEIYVVARGTALFFDGVTRHSVRAGSFIFVPAFQVHRFERFSADFAVWVFFYGPRGGETSKRGDSP